MDKILLALITMDYYDTLNHNGKFTIVYVCVCVLCECCVRGGYEYVAIKNEN